MPRTPDIIHDQFKDHGRNIVQYPMGGYGIPYMGGVGSRNGIPPIPRTQDMSIAKKGDLPGSDIGMYEAKEGEIVWAYHRIDEDWIKGRIVMTYKNTDKRRREYKVAPINQTQSEIWTYSIRLI